MKTAIVQSDIVWKDIRANLAHLDAFLAEIPGECGMVVLPEMFSTGFVTFPEGCADAAGESLAWMRAKAAERGCCMVGSVSTADGDRFCNRMYLVRPDGSFDSYDKRHLFGAEREAYSSGSARMVGNACGLRVMMQVCYDLRFPCFSRNVSPEGGPLYDVLVYVASWPESRSDAWKTLLKARAIENRCYVVGVNRCGSDPGNSYSGDSVILGPSGETLAACAPSKEGWAMAELSPEDLDAARASFPVLSHADDFTLIY